MPPKLVGMVEPMPEPLAGEVVLSFSAELQRATNTPRRLVVDYARMSCLDLLSNAAIGRVIRGANSVIRQGAAQDILSWHRDERAFSGRPVVFVLDPKVVGWHLAMEDWYNQ